MKIIGSKKGKPFSYNKKNKGKVWVSPNEAFAKTASQTKNAAKLTRNWLS